MISTRLISLVIALACAAAVMLSEAASASAATFTVTSRDDADDGTCNAAHCSLREAIEAANATSAADEILFNDDEPVTPLTALPAITKPAHFSSSSTGRCRSDSAFLRLDGDGADFPGLVFAPGSDGSRLCAVNVRGFRNGIEFRSDNNSIRLSRIGTDFDGTVADPNSDTGILVSGDSNRIGGTRGSDRNIISGNTVHGILVAEAADTRITGNLIGTDASATASVANGIGVHVLEEATATVIGGTDPDTGNVISGNRSEVISGDGRVVGNLIGLNGTGTAAIAGDGVGIDAFAPIRIGGPTAAERNVIAGHEIDLAMSAAATVHGNWIGMAADGTKLPGEQRTTGIRLASGADGATVGGTGDGEGNVIAGHFAAVESSDAVRDLAIQGNLIGLAPDGTTAIATEIGVKLGAATTGTLVGGTDEGAGNTVVAENGTGITVAGDSTRIEGNSIGLNAEGGPADQLTGFFGVVVEDGAESSTIGGDDPGAGNTISANDAGVELREGSTGTVVEGNMIGTDQEGKRARGNTIGVSIGEDDASGTGRIEARIGGTRPAQRNVISANEYAAVSAACPDADVVIEGNFIGVGADGTTPLGNGAGVALGCPEIDAPPLTSEHGFVVGGTAPGAGNRIANGNGDGESSGDGVEVEHTNGGVMILGNEIFDNGGIASGVLGIDAFGNGVTPNGFHPGDLLPPFPVLTRAELVTAGTSIQGSIDFPAGRDVRLEFFANPRCSDSGHGEGRTPLGALTLTGSGGPAAFSALVTGVAPGAAITATVTDLERHRTSEFSRCALVAAGTPERLPDPPASDPSSPPGPAGPPAPGPVSGPTPPLAIPVTDQPPKLRCKVPNIAGLSLPKAKKRLAAAGCRIGKVTRPARRPGRNFRLVVKRTHLKKGTTRPRGTTIKITLRWKPINTGSH